MSGCRVGFSIIEHFLPCVAVPAELLLNDDCSLLLSSVIFLWQSYSAGLPMFGGETRFCKNSFDKSNTKLASDDHSRVVLRPSRFANVEIDIHCSLEDAPYFAIGRPVAILVARRVWRSYSQNVEAKIRTTPACRHRQLPKRAAWQENASRRSCVTPKNFIGADWLTIKIENWLPLWFVRVRWEEATIWIFDGCQSPPVLTPCSHHVQAMLQFCLRHVEFTIQCPCRHILSNEISVLASGGQNQIINVE